MKKLTICLLLVLPVLTFAVFAHPGRTDAQGGHYDRSTGLYHFHHGYSAHQHTGGVCPYAYDDKTGENSGGSSSSGSSSGGSGSSGGGGSASGGSGSSGGGGSGSAATTIAAEDPPEPEKPVTDRYAEGYRAGRQFGYEAGEQSVVKPLQDQIKNLQDQIKDLQAWKDALLPACIVLAVVSLIFISLFVSGRKDNTSPAVSARLLHESAQLKEDIAQLQSALEQSAARASHAERLARDNTRKARTLEEALQRRTADLSAQTNALQRAQAALTALRQEQEATAQASPAAAGALVTFGKWSPAAHQTDAQYKRYLRAVREPLRLEAIAGKCAIVHGASGSVYHTTLNACDCPDFVKNLQGSAPCKHIYFLAGQIGLPISELFHT